MTGLGSFSGPSLRGVAWGEDGQVGLLLSLHPVSCLILGICFFSFPVSVFREETLARLLEGLGRGTQSRVLSRAGVGGERTSIHIAPKRTQGSTNINPL